jgi:hypothetical protein
MPPLTEQELNAPGGMSTAQGGYMSGYNPWLETPKAEPIKLDFPTAPTSTAVTTPTTPTAPRTPTIGETLAGITSQAQVIQEKLNALKAKESLASGIQYDQGPDLTSLGKVETEEDIARRMRKLFRNEINATNRVYDDLLRDERLAGQGRLGTATARAARGGLLGSNMGDAQYDNMSQYNFAEQRQIQNERMAKIGAIEGTMRKAVADELERKRIARKEGTESLIAYHTADKTRRAENAQLAARTILAQGLDAKTMTEDELNAIGKQAGLSAKDIILAYSDLQAASETEALKTRKTEAEISKIEADIASGKFKTIGEGTMLINTETGESMINPKTYKPDAPSGLKIGAGTLSQEAVADVHATLNESRGADRYANTQVYMDEFNGFVASGGDPKDFIKEYSPDIYINPNDPTRSFLQPYMKTTPREAVEKELTALEQLQQLQEMQANQ